MTESKEELMTKFIKNAKLSDIDGKTQLYIDCDHYYYTGMVEPELFPQDIRNSYLEIVSKSFEGYTDNTTKISGYFENGNLSADNMYIVDILFTSTFYKNQQYINIPLTITKKDRVDYLESKVNSLTQELLDVKEILQILIKNNKALSDSEDTDEEEDAEEDHKKSRAKVVVTKLQPKKSKY